MNCTFLTSKFPLFLNSSNSAVAPFWPLPLNEVVLVMVGVVCETLVLSGPLVEAIDVITGREEGSTEDTRSLSEMGPLLWINCEVGIIVALVGGAMWLVGGATADKRAAVTLSASEFFGRKSFQLLPSWSWRRTFILTIDI